MVKQLAIVAIVLALRLPFLHQAIQGDDLYYLYGAEHAQIEPLHPDHARFLFEGDLVDMRGHSHGPLNSWILGALLWTLGDVKEVPFHAAYSIFSIVAALAMYSLARRFCEKPFLATLLFMAVPAFVVNGNSLEADLPFLALWMLTMALFAQGSRGALIGSAVAGALASLDAYQAVLLTPILGFYLWHKKSRDAVAWASVFAAPAAILAWNLFGRMGGGAMPAAVLAGYMQKYAFQALAQKLRNAGALIVHSAWIVSPLLIRGSRWNWALGAVAAAGGAFYDPSPMFWASLGLGVVALSSCFPVGRPMLKDRVFLQTWVLIFFAGALVIFFAGSARYLLPIAAPVAMLAAARCGIPMLGLGFALQMALSVCLSVVNYQTWGAYRQFAESLAPEAAQTRVWVDHDWGLRYYLESEGALAVPRGQTFAAGDVVVSRTAHPNGQLISSLEIRPSIPLRLFSMNHKSAYSLASQGLWPFEISSAPVDRVRAELIGERKAELSWLTPNDQAQVLRGLYPDGWMTGEATVLLKRAAGPLRAEFFIHEKSTARTVKLLVDGKVVAEQTFPGPGAYSLSAQVPGSDAVNVSLTVDRTFSVPGDGRQLGILIQGIGFKP
ncbi:MAG TPA: hypothetical protein VMT15_09740 [Bryobacteraceae bacterium]|nr:hypothetical protein [Bryobacteraceae bacterium]